MSVLYSDVIWYHLNGMGIQTNPSKLQSVTSVFTGTRLSAATKNSTILNCFHHYSSHQELSLAEPSKFKNPYSTTKLACQVLLSWGKNFLWELNFANFAVFSKIHEIKLLQSFSKWTIRKIEFLQNFKKSSNHEIKFPQNFSKFWLWFLLVFVSFFPSNNYINWYLVNHDDLFFFQTIFTT